MLKDRQEILALGELALFVAVWATVLWNAVDFYRQRAGLLSGGSVAASSLEDALPPKFQ